MQKKYGFLKLYLLFFFSFQAVGEQQVDPLGIGFVLPLTGSQSSLGLRAQKTAMAYFEEWKLKDPGLKAHLMIEDSGSTYLGAKESTQKLLQQRASVIIGPISYLSNKEVSFLSNNDKKLHISLVSDLDSQLTFTYSAFMSLTDIAKQLAGYGVKDLHIKKFISPPLRETRDLFSDALYQELKSLRADVYPDYKLLNSSGNEIVGYFLLDSDLKKTFEEKKLILEKFPKAVFFGSPKWNKTSYKKDDLLIYYPAQFPFGYDYSSNLTIQKMKEEQSSVDLLTLAVCDSIDMIFHAYKESKSTQTPTLIKAMNKLKNIPGVFGNFSINQSRQIQKDVKVLQSRLSPAPAPTLTPTLTPTPMANGSK